MFCKNCGNKLNENSRFCEKCGTSVVYDVHNNVINPNQEVKNNKNKNVVWYIIGGIVGILLVGNVIKSVLVDIQYKNDENDINSSINSDNKDNVKGEYSREIFSGNTFEYITSSSKAEFKFNKDSTFEVSYSTGEIYKGKYEIYNGGYILTAKCFDLKQNINIKNNLELAEDIEKVYNVMYSSYEDLVNIYLVWLEVEDGKTIQPFMIKYDNEKKEGAIVNILGRIQGTIKEKND